MNPLILAIDTTREAGSLALARGEELVEEILLHAPGGFAHVIYGQLAQLLGRHGVKPAMVDCFAAASGPGSFTGVRVGLACIKGLAEALGKPAVAVSNLEAMASFGSAPRRAVVMDARRGEIYGAVYDDAGRLASPEVVVPAPPGLAPNGSRRTPSGSPLRASRWHASWGAKLRTRRRSMPTTCAARMRSCCGGSRGPYCVTFATK